MLNELEKINVQDKMFAKVLDIDDDEVRKISLHQMKNEMQTRAFHLRENNQTITQEEADALSNQLNEIIEQLEVLGYDPMEDYMIDFDNFVVGSESHNKFCW